jgi:hypothetical protein
VRKLWLLGCLVSMLALAGCLAPGTRSVGSNLGAGQTPPGLWRTIGGESCYWARLRGLSGQSGDIIASSLTHGGPRYVRVLNSDAAFETKGCVPFWQEPGPFAKPLAVPGQPFGAGDFGVGYEVAAGTYTAPGSSLGQACVWRRLSGFGGESSDIIDSQASSGVPQTVTIAPLDAGFSSDGCGTWTTAA